MTPIIRNILAVIIGILGAMLLNSGIVMLGSQFAPAPAGMDPNDTASIAAHIHEFTLGNFLVPFLAHALGTLLGAFLATKIAANRQMAFALVIGSFFLAAGIYMCILIPAPMWFIALDLLVAYIPMALLGYWLGRR